MEFLKMFNYSEFSISISDEVNKSLLEQLIRDDNQEDLVFAFWLPSEGERRLTAVISEILLPEKGDRNVHGNASFNTKYLLRALKIASQNKMGLVFLHSHPFPGWQFMSNDDIVAEKRIQKNVDSLLNFPLVGMTVGSDGTWSGRVWYYSNLDPVKKTAKNIRVAGREYNIYFHDEQYKNKFLESRLKRTINVWGYENQLKITRLRYGIIGLGSVGSVIAEMLARQGVSDVVTIDFDKVEEHNLDRLLTASYNDIGKYKVDVTFERMALICNSENLDITLRYEGIQKEKSYKSALDCDVLISCVDRPWPRHILNHISYAHLIPVIDGGIGIEITKNNEILFADWQSQIVAPNRPCLNCLCVYEKSDVDLEKSGMLDNPEYIRGANKALRNKMNENIFPFSLNLGSNMFMQLISYILGISNQDYNYPLRFRFLDAHLSKLPINQCKEGCEFQRSIGITDKYFKMYI